MNYKFLSSKVIYLIFLLYTSDLWLNFRVWNWRAEVHRKMLKQIDLYLHACVYTSSHSNLTVEAFSSVHNHVFCIGEKLWVRLWLQVSIQPKQCLTTRYVFLTVISVVRLEKVNFAGAKLPHYEALRGEKPADLETTVILPESVFKAPEGKRKFGAREWKHPCILEDSDWEEWVSDAALLRNPPWIIPCLWPWNVIKSIYNWYEFPSCLSELSVQNQIDILILFPQQLIFPTKALWCCHNIITFFFHSLMSLIWNRKWFLIRSDRHCT